MKKVGIITFHRAHNYGAVLQCLALKTVVEDLGYEAHVIDHRNKEIEKYYKLLNSDILGSGVFQVLNSALKFGLVLSPKLRRIRKFKSFIKRFLVDPGINNDSCKDYDCLIYGSDQIWNGKITGNDLFYWGINDNKDVKKISYAGSAGQIDDFFDRNTELFNVFSEISVREKDLREYLIKRGITTHLSIDPTLLIDQKRWGQIIPLKRVAIKQYILVYSMRNRNKVIQIAKCISQNESIPIIEIFNNCLPVRNAYNRFSAGDPIDFLSLISNAKYVITDSFHGTAFSVIFNKQFVTIELKDGQDNRSKSLLSSIGLLDRITESGYNYKEKIDYEKVNIKLNIIRNDSLKYLKNALNDVDMPFTK